ncbi:hypothetical protein GGR42_002535 [Saonia flava]|uniref:CAAX prenyl protease 2/Lysostaphin resistance protein A-like domain-containing protein n=1 Tax=Saonia flava TaxID=523696 RepID=A0A846R3W4_9FLAO|nr:type II CAAX endopeptidase family protein [Saonia flava]NJB72044.1 hypothetical protein [Saonia flava]
MIEQESKNVGWYRVLLLVLPYFFIVGIFQYIGVLAAGVDLSENSPEETVFQQFIIGIFNLLGTFLVVWIFMKFVDKQKFVQLGLQIKNRIKDIVTGTLFGAIIMGAGYILLYFLEEIQFTGVVLNFTDLTLIILHFFIVALVEEVLFRGYILRNLMISFNKYIALFLSSGLFSLMHGFNPNISQFSLMGLFLSGVLLGATYIFTKNLWFPIALHFSWNLFQSLLGFNVSGQDSYSIVEHQIVEANLINGGAFGFEGSYLSIIAQLILIFGIIYYYSYKTTKHNTGYNL